MLQEFRSENFVDSNGNPAGGYVDGTGLSIQWQDGPLGRGADRQLPNGAFVETVIAAALQRIQFYQTASNGKFVCEENQDAIEYLKEGLQRLNDRTRSREQRQVEGTHER